MVDEMPESEYPKVMALWQAGIVKIFQTNAN